MPTLEWNLTLLTRTLDDGGARVVEPLRFPEVSCCGDKGSRVRGAARALARQLLARAAAHEVHRRAVPGVATVDRVEVTLDPPRRRPDWVGPVTLGFHVARWRHDERTHLALVPALGIEVVARGEDELPRLVREHVLAALRRTRAAESLFALALAQRDAKLSLRPATLRVRHRTAKQVARAEEDEAGAKREPVIAAVGVVLAADGVPQAFEADAVVAQLADLLGGRVPRSVLLVGPSGAGKTAAVRELARRRPSPGMSAVPVWGTSGSRLIAGASGFGVWQERCQRLCKEAARDGAVLHVGNLVELMQVGRVGGSQGIAGFLKAPLGRGELLAIAECTPEQLSVIERQDPHLLELFQQVKVVEPDGAAVRRILRAVAGQPGPPRAALPEEALRTIDQLHRRYATYSAAPGRPVRFLGDLLRDQPVDRPVTPADVVAAFSRETGLPAGLLDPDVPLDLRAARAGFAQQLIGQDRAVDLVVDLLATVKAQLARPRRPIASLLFVGPTGVGKTEMAKALAGYLFGDRARLTRFDMSEFATPAAVERLVGGGNGGAEGLLTAKVREQPFSVVLLDEFEKGHPAAFDLLLQVLGDGRLTDAAGRVADFTNAVVILTSNLGAESFGRGAFGLNRGDDTFAGAEDHFTDAVRSFVRPELFNRLDRVVPFLPLDMGAILQIADRELALVERRDGFRLRGLTMNVTADARRALAEKGYDVRYGARPLKRAVERQLLGPLADAVNRYPAGARLHADAVLADGALAVTVRAKLDGAGRVVSSTTSGSGAAAAAEACAELRRDVQRLVACPPVLTATNLLFQLERVQKRAEAKAKAKGKPEYDAVRAEQIRELRDLLDGVSALAADADAAEDLALSDVYAEAASDSGVDGRLPAMRRQLRDLLLRLRARQVAKPNRVVVGLFGDPSVVVLLAAAYHAVARAAGFAVALCWYDVHDRSAFGRHAVDDAAKMLESPPAALAGVAMSIAGPYARLHFAAERGVHVVARDGKAKACLVDAGDRPLRDYSPPGVNTWPTHLAGIDARRTYDLSAGVAEDGLLKRELRWTGRSVEPVVAAAIEQQLDRAVRGVLGA